MIKAILIAIAAFLAITAIPDIIKVIREISSFIWRKRIEAEMAHEAEKKRKEEREKFERLEAERIIREEERKEKYEYMTKVVGLEPIEIRDTIYFFEAKNGHIKALYDINQKRIPLATLAMHRAARPTGLDPTIYLFSYKVTKHDMLEDESEISKA